MARLTILQASQQGFGSTLAIHRHIKDGMLPVYEEGDTKLLDVDDLISVFGEPGKAASDTVAPAANGQVDIHEFNRIKAELEQKNKKNMWLAADLAEVVRELKEKEAGFEKERNRLLTVLEQAQVLLLREAGKDGEFRSAMDKMGKAGILDEDVPAVPSGAPEVNETSGAETDSRGTLELNQPAPVDTDIQAPPDADLPAEQTLDDLLPKLGIPAADATADETENIAGNPGAPLDDNMDMPVPAEAEATTDINPLMPPLDESAAQPRKTRSISITTWVLLVAMIGGGFIFFENRAKVISGLTKLGKLVSGF